MADDGTISSETVSDGQAVGVDAVPAERRRGRRHSAHTTRDLTKGSIPRNLWFLAWPQVAEGFLSVADQIADLIWAGRISFQAIAALGVAQSYLMLIMTARMGLDSGMRSMISRAVGARQVAYANHVLLQSLTLTTGLAFVMVAIGIFLTVPMLRLLGLSDEVVAQAAAYMRLQFVAMALMSYQRLSGGALQAAGDSMTPLKAATVTRISHLVLSPLFIFGWGFFPEMGIAGAAMANLVAQLMGGGLNFFALMRGRTLLQLSFRGYRIDLPLIWRVIRIGAPASVTGSQRGISQLIVLGIVATFGDAAVAAFALTRRAENLVNQSSRGMGRAAGALAGQNLGANQPERAKNSLRWALIYVTLLTIPVVVIFLAVPGAVASFFNADAEFVAAAKSWLIIAALGYLSMSAVQVLTQAFNTSGDTMAPMVVTLVAVWLIEIPLSFTLSNFTSLGAFGVAWAIVIGMTARLAVFAWYYSRGTWLRVGVV
ncbi:MAG: MATE family efflux transporter [Chloroflexi bacterium]|nr:MATE family efflux transporter [Chloroflexota bacterium]